MLHNFLEKNNTASWCIKTDPPPTLTNLSVAQHMMVDKTNHEKICYITVYNLHAIMNCHSTIAKTWMEQKDRRGCYCDALVCHLWWRIPLSYSTGVSLNLPRFEARVILNIKFGNLSFYFILVEDDINKFLVWYRHTTDWAYRNGLCHHYYNFYQWFCLLKMYIMNPFISHLNSVWTCSTNIIDERTNYN